jgi:hypothetical protein
MSRSEKVESWRAIVAEFNGSGLSGAAFCRDRGLKVVNLLRWRRVFAAGSPVPGDLPSPSGSSGFLEIIAKSGGGCAPTAGGCGICLELGGGMRISLSPGFDAGALRAVLQVVRGLSQPC